METGTLAELGVYSAVFFAGQQYIGNQKARQQTFSVLDPSISFPYTSDTTVSVGVSRDTLGAWADSGVCQCRQRCYI